MKKYYSQPITEVIWIAGSSVMLGASGDIHTYPEEGSQSGNRIRKLFGAPVF